MASVQTLRLDRHTDAVRAALDRLRAQRFLLRLWDKDASLWSSDPATQDAIRQRLGWLTISRVMAAQTAALKPFAQEIRAAGLRRALLLGMGGSGLFSEVCRKTFGIAAGYLDLAVLDTTDPTAIRAAQDQGPPTQLLVIVSSKSGTTSEVSALSKYFYELFRPTGHPGAHCIAVTDQGSPLEAQAATLQYRRAFVHGPSTGADVGGRFSALTYFGLVPASLMGIEIDVLLGRATEMLERCGPAVSLEENPAAVLGAALGGLALHGRGKMTLLCPPALESFGTWVEQLVAESTGKSGKGIAPFYGEPLDDAEMSANDRLFVELQLASSLDASLDQQVRALSDAGHPVVRIRWQDRYDVGGEVIRWFLATTIAGSLMEINPFDEPNVQESKDLIKSFLAQYARDRRFAPDAAVFSNGHVSVYSSPQAKAGGSLVQCLSDWLRGARPQDYIAILSFLPRTRRLDDAVQALRQAFARTLRRATTVGFGPRYLHSTGQLYKGGADAAIFLELTADESNDLPIPGEPFTFGVLKQAQALGDFQAMQQKGRRILRVHLHGDLDRSMQQLLSAVEEVASIPGTR